MTCNVALLKACSSFLTGEEGKTKGEFCCRQEEGASNTVLKAGERARLNMVVCEAGALVPGSNVLLIEEGSSVFLGKFFYFLLLLSVDEEGRSSPQFWYCSVLSILLILAAQY